MKRALLLLTLLVSSVSSAQTARTRLLDYSADVLAPEESELGLVWLRYARGIVPGFELSTQALGYLVTWANVRAKYQFLQLPTLRVSIETNPQWLVAAQWVDMTLIRVPSTVRGTLPLADGWDATVGATYDILHVQQERQGQNVNSRTFLTELVLTRYDAHGAFFLRGEAPLFATQEQVFQLPDNRVLRALSTVDDVPAWSVLFGRDQIFGQSAHFRIGAGYRNRPGLLLIQSLGQFLFQLDLYWR